MPESKICRHKGHEKEIHKKHQTSTVIRVGRRTPPSTEQPSVNHTNSQEQQRSKPNLQSGIKTMLWRFLLCEQFSSLLITVMHEKKGSCLLGWGKISNCTVLRQVGSLATITNQKIL